MFCFCLLSYSLAKQLHEWISSCEVSLIYAKYHNLCKNFSCCFFFHGDGTNFVRSSQLKLNIVHRCFNLYCDDFFKGNLNFSKTFFILLSLLELVLGVFVLKCITENRLKEK